MIPQRHSNYFAYKKRKFQNATLTNEKKTVSKFNFMFQLFIATFVFIFILIVFTIMKYSQKIDIEYSNNDYTQNKQELATVQDNSQKSIDKRLLLIQQEENAPSEAKIVTDKKNNTEVIDPKIIEENKKLDKKEKIQQKETNKQDNNGLKNILDEIKNNKTQNDVAQPDNITIISKILVGKYETFEDATKAQEQIKINYSQYSPYVKKIGEVYSVQMGSYQDLNIAKIQAQKLKSKGLDVWIFQQ